MIKKTFAYIVSAVAVATPLVAFAASNSTLATLIDKIISYANRILVLMMGIAVVMFVYYIIKYFIKADADRKEGATYVMYSLIGFFVILSFWGLVNILQNTFGLQNDTNRPSGWTSFTNIFPGGGSGRTSNDTYDWGTQGAPSINSSPITAPDMWSTQGAPSRTWSTQGASTQKPPASTGSSQPTNPVPSNSATFGGNKSTATVPEAQ